MYVANRWRASSGFNNNKGIEEICGKSTLHGSFLRLAAVTEIFSKKNNNPFLDKINGNMSAKYPGCMVFRLARRRDTNT